MPGAKPSVSRTAAAKFGSGIEIFSGGGSKSVISIENECPVKFPCTSITRKTIVSLPTNLSVTNSTVLLFPLKR